MADKGNQKTEKPILRLNLSGNINNSNASPSKSFMTKENNHMNIDNEENQNSIKKTPKPKEPQKKRMLLDRADYQEILRFMQKHYPKAFPSTGSPLPLAVGVHEQIFAIDDLPFSRMKIRKFLRIYTGKKKYRAELIADHYRYNIDGTQSSQISPEEAKWSIWKDSKAEKSKIASHDSLVKKVMENPIAASEFLEEFMPAEFKDMLDLTTLKVEKESYVEDSLKTRFSDIVYSVQTKSENDVEPETAFIYTLLEHQASSDHWIALRLWKYSLLLLERHAKKKNKLPAVLPLVLYNGKRKYSAPRNIWELFAYPALAKKAMSEDYNLIDLNAMSDEDIDYEKHLSFVLYSMKHIHERDTLKMLQQAMHRCTKALIIDKGKDYVHTKLIFWYTNAKVPEENKQLLEQLIVDNLPKEDKDNIMRTIADTYIEEGIAIGETRGKQLGIEEGIEQGAHTKAAEIARRMLKENTDIKFISSVTGLSTDEVLKIQNKI